MGMNSALSIGVAGLNSFSSALSVVSDNVANANTTAFKSSSVRFGDMVAGYYATLSQDNDRQGSGSAILSIDTNLSQGTMTSTGNWSDLSINGNGYFSVQDATGTYYTRDGGFHIDSTGNFVNSEGRGVLNSSGSAINIPLNTYSSYSVSSSGQISGTRISDGSSVVIDTMRVSTFPNPASLTRTGANCYVPSTSSGAAVNGTAGTSPCGSIIGSSLEGSNVDLATEMVNMVTYQADYTANSKSIQTANNMLNTVVNLIT